MCVLCECLCVGGVFEHKQGMKQSRHLQVCWIKVNIEGNFSGRRAMEDEEMSFTGSEGRAKTKAAKLALITVTVFIDCRH